MTQSFISTSAKFSDWKKSVDDPMKIVGASPAQWLFILKELLGNKSSLIGSSNHLVIAPDNTMAESLYNQLKQSEMVDTLFLFYPGLEQSPYSSILPSEHDLFSRLRALHSTYSTDQRVVIIASIEAACLQTAPPAFFKENKFEITREDILSPDELASKLYQLGYEHVVSVEEPGTFCKKGEVFDVFPVTQKPVRFTYFDDLIEHIHPIDLATNISDKSVDLDSVLICCSPHIVKNDHYINLLRNNIPMPAPGFRNRYEERKKIFENLRENHLFDDYPKYFPLFFEETKNLWEHLEDKNIIVHKVDNLLVSNSLEELFERLRTEEEKESLDHDSSNLISELELIYKKPVSKLPVIELENIEVHVSGGLQNRISYRFEPYKTWIQKKLNPFEDKATYIKNTFDVLYKLHKSGHKIVFSVSSENSKSEIKHLLEQIETPPSLSDGIDWTRDFIDEGFVFEAEKIIIVSESDLFSKKQKKTKKSSRRDVDLFAEQLGTLKPGDFVIHNTHGMGIYKGLESMDVGGDKSDFLLIEYDAGDKVYLPVYKMNLIQKHADSSASLKPANLRNNKFEKLKQKAKSAIKQLAFDLLELQAKRESEEAFSFSPPDVMFREFEKDFPFTETPDQILAIEDVLSNMQKSRPMDHLVCGDVGFGKTEIAMRAAYKAVLDGKQVAVLVPTTILALQHYNSFKKRFSNYAVEVDFLTRFKNAKEAKETVHKLEDGKVDIVIGTHKLLSDKIRFHDLGLVIVDEEQRFGVGHKEKLKLMKASVDFLTLTATPIPRTMQMAFLGLRDLSLIQTAPPKRQSIKSYLIKHDDHTIKAAIEQELNRGGQVFIVHNKVQDMEQFQAYIRELVPEAKIIHAHGQMKETELEKRMTAFYNGEYQILIATTIIESGLDIPNANTMIIDRADTYGLAQLHQLRGRIGRSDRKAYAYFVIPNTRSLTPLAEKRLKALQTYADMGSGFSIASSDLEIRGAGDILGANQSGHIESIGLELYMELLKDAIHELKGEQPESVVKDIEISTPFQSYIPPKYIPDAGERLKTYKKLSNARSTDTIIETAEKMNDIYGFMPAETRNLIDILKVRVLLQKTGIKSAQLMKSSFILIFDRDYVSKNEELRDRIIQIFTTDPKTYQLSPDYSVTYSSKREIGLEQFLLMVKDIAQQIVPC